MVVVRGFRSIAVRAAAAAVLALPPGAASAHGQETRVPAKSPIEVEVLQNLNSRLDRAGDVVRFRVAADLVVEGRVVVAAGTLVDGRVRLAERSATNGRAGALQLVIPSLPAVDGGRLRLWGEVIASGRDRSTASAATQIGVGPLGLAIHGREAAHLIGDRFTVRTRDEATVGPPAAPGGGGAPPEPSDSAVMAAVAEPITVSYVVGKGSLPGALEIRIPKVGALEGVLPDSAALVSLDGVPLANPLRPAAVEDGRRRMTVSFPAWPVVRRLQGSPEGLVHEAVLALQRPGGRALVTASVTLKLE